LSVKVRRRTEELEKSYEQLKQVNRQLQSHNKVQKEFIDVATHHLRTPIQPTILGCRIKDRDQSELLEVIIRNAKRLRQLAENILDLSKIDSDRLTLEKAEFNLVGVIEGATKEYQTPIQEYDMTFPSTLLSVEPF